MNYPLRENLIGYLVGAVEPEERAQIEQQLAHDESARHELELLRTSLSPLADDRVHHEPPVGLAQRCCDYVFSRTEVMPAALSPSGNSTNVTRRWSWLELSVAGAIAAAVAIFFLPKIYQSQLQSQLFACQNNLKDIALASQDYGQRNGGYYPAVQPGDHVNAVGMWAPKLVTQQYLPQPGKTLICPSASDAGNPAFHAPTVQEVEAMDAALLARMLPQLSGSYDGPLGYRENGTGAYKLQRIQGRPNFAAMADKAGPNGTNSPNHGGQGQNVAWDDGHTSFITIPQTASGDNIYLNKNHEVAPGLDANDAVAAPSDIRVTPEP